jgi:VanZ family protein
MLLIFILSSFPAPEVVHHVPIWYHIKLVHLVEYGFLCFLFLQTLNDQPIQKRIFLAILFTTLYGVTDEIHQMFVPNRTAQLVDIITNFLGAVTISMVYIPLTQTFVPSKKKL